MTTKDDVRMFTLLVVGKVCEAFLRLLLSPNVFQSFEHLSFEENLDAHITFSENQCLSIFVFHSPDSEFSNAIDYLVL